MNCADCGRSFTPARSDAKTCSAKCRARMFRTTHRHRGETQRQADYLALRAEADRQRPPARSVRMK